MEKRPPGNMEMSRHPFQGVWNIIRFNWHFYIISALLFAVIFFAQRLMPQPYKLLLGIFSIGLLYAMFASLLVSFYVYDLSGLYEFKWINSTLSPLSILNINAGFDETTAILKRKFSSSEITPADFYDPAKHTEPSIKRARKAYPPFDGTKQVDTRHLPFADNSFDDIFVIFAAHEIRVNEERAVFFQELARIIRPSGQITVTEHRRDFINFLAFNIGFLHFYSRQNWLGKFKTGNLKVKQELKITPFISTFILHKDGTAF